MARRKKETPEQLHADLMAKLKHFTAREKLLFQNLLVTDTSLDLCFLSGARASNNRHLGRLAEAKKKLTRRKAEYAKRDEEIVRLYDGGDWTFQSIADHLGIPSGGAAREAYWRMKRPKLRRKKA